MASIRHSRAEPVPVEMGTGIQAFLNWTPVCAGVTFILQLIFEAQQ